MVSHLFQILYFLSLIESVSNDRNLFDQSILLQFYKFSDNISHHQKKWVKIEAGGTKLNHLNSNWNKENQKLLPWPLSLSQAGNKCKNTKSKILKTKSLYIYKSIFTNFIFGGNQSKLSTHLLLCFHGREYVALSTETLFFSSLLWLHLCSIPERTV